MTSSKSRILVTGATGSIGRHVVARLAEREASVRVVVRDPAKLEPRAAAAAQVVVGDLDRPETLEPAFVGIDRLFLLSPGPNVEAQDATLIGVWAHRHARDTKTCYPATFATAVAIP